MSREARRAKDRERQEMDRASDLKTAGTLSAENVDDGTLRVRPASIVSFHDIKPQDTAADGVRSWFGRSDTTVVTYSEGDAGMTLRRHDQPDEHFLVLAEKDAAITVESTDGIARVHGRSVVIVPPGDSAVRFERPGSIIRVFTIRGAADLAAKGFNAANYVEPDNFLHPFEEWPMPVGGYRLRVYERDAYSEGPDCFSAIFRSRNLMVNWVKPIEGWNVLLDAHARLRLNTHRHYKIDQTIVVLHGEFTAHARVPWTADTVDWREDRHESLRAPGFFVAPPRLVHGVVAVGSGFNEVFDCFSPPRLDYAGLPDSVNGNDYPPPRP